MKSLAWSDEASWCISLMSAPPMNEGALPGAVVPPVRTTARRLGSEESSLQVDVSWSRICESTMFSFSGLDTVIVATLLPGLSSCLVTVTPAGLVVVAE